MRRHLLLLVHLGVALGAKCYYPNGGDAGIDQPCDPDAENSMCCAGGDFGFVCLENKLCLGNSGKVVRGSCTDKSWESSDCLSKCTNEDYKGHDLVSCQNVTGSDTSFCCDGVSNCCDSGVGRFEVFPAGPRTWAKWSKASDRYVVVLPVSTSMSTTSTSTSSTSKTQDSTASSTPDSGDSDKTSRSTAASDTTTSGSTQQTSSGNSQDSQLPTESAGLSTGAKAGIGIGAACGAILIAAVAILAWKLHKAKETSSLGGAPSQQWQPEYGTPTSGGVYGGSDVRYKTELPTDYQYKTELPVEREIHEMGGGPQMYQGQPAESPVLTPGQNTQPSQYQYR